MGFVDLCGVWILSAFVVLGLFVLGSFCVFGVWLAASCCLLRCGVLCFVGF